MSRVIKYGGDDGVYFHDIVDRCLRPSSTPCSWLSCARLALCLRTTRTSGPEPAVMSKARLDLTAVSIEKRPVSEVSRSYGVARSWIYALLARYRAEGKAAFEPRSRRQRS